MMTVLETIDLIESNIQALDRAVLDGHLPRARRLQQDIEECRQYIREMEDAGLADWE